METYSKASDTKLKIEITETLTLEYDLGQLNAEIKKLDDMLLSIDQQYFEAKSRFSKTRDLAITRLNEANKAGIITPVEAAPSEGVKE